MANLSIEEPYAVMPARTGLWEPRDGNDPGPPGPERASGFVLRAHVDNSDADGRLAFSCVGEIDRRAPAFPV